MKLVTLTSDGGLTFSDGTRVSDAHAQDCCEHVYADWDVLNDLSIWQEEWPDGAIKIEGVPESGFRINGYFVPCYNEQNGYYSDDLALQIERPGKDAEIIDITAFVEDRIN